MTQEMFQTTEIDGDTYKVYMLDPFVASDLVADLASILVPALAAMTEKNGAAGSDGDDVSVVGFERAAALFFSRFDKAKQREIITAMSKVTVVVKGSAEPKLETIFAVHFRGRLGAMYKWLAWAMKVQFSDFFDSVGPAIKSAVRGLLQAQ